MTTLVYKLVAACYNDGAVLSRHRQAQLQGLVDAAVKQYPASNLSDTLREIADTDSLDGELINVDAVDREPFDIIRMMSNILTVFIVKAFEYHNANPDSKGAKHKADRAAALLPLLIIADEKWSLVAYTHRRALCGTLRGPLLDYKGWSRRGSISANTLASVPEGG